MRFLTSALVVSFALASQAASAAQPQPYVARVHPASGVAYAYLVPKAHDICAVAHAAGARKVARGVAVERLAKLRVSCAGAMVGVEEVTVVDGHAQGAKGYIKETDLLPAPDLSPTAAPMAK